MGYFNSISSLLQDGSTYLSKRHPLDMLAEGSHLQCLNHKPQKNWSPTGHLWEPTSISVVRITQKWHVWPDVATHFIHSGSGLRFIFTFRPWHTVHQHMSWANCCESTKKFMRQMAAKVMSSSTSMSDFQTSKLSKSGKQKYRSKSASFSYQNSEEIHEKKNIRDRSKSALFLFSYQNSEEIHEKKTFALQVLKRCTGPPWWKVQCTKHSFT